jgi:hypothetical protein
MEYTLVESHTAADGRVYDILVLDNGVAPVWSRHKRNQLFAVVDRELDEPLEIKNTGGRYHYIELRSARNRIKRILAK